MFKLITFFFSLALLFNTSLALAGSPNTTLSFDNMWYGQENYVVEQQSDQHWPPDPLRYNPDWLHYVVNTDDNCKWSGDDNADILKVGMIAKANTTVAGNYCKVLDSSSADVCINDQCARYSFAKAEGIGFYLSSKTNVLNVSMVIKPQNKVVNIAPVYMKDTRTYLYRICIIGYYDFNDPALQFIPGSNGSNDPNSVEGRGVKSYFQPTVTNSTNKDIRDIAYFMQAFGASQNGSGPCYDDAPLQSHQFGVTVYQEYPFSWYN